MVLEVSKKVDNILFDERINSVFYADYRVFIYGTDVTDYVTGSISYNYCDKDGYNVASLTLQNAYDNFVVTQENLGLRPDPNNPGKLISTGNNVFRTGSSTSKMYDESAKQRIMQLKKEYETSAGGSTTGKLYPLSLRNTCIHKNDPIRIFINNPLRVLTNDWMCVFTGYVDSVNVSKNYITGESQLSINCYDIRALMQKMRVQISPINGELAFREKLYADAPGLFADIILKDSSTYDHPFYGQKYEDVMEQLIIGYGKKASEVERDPNTSLPNEFRGIGSMDKGDLYFFDNQVEDRDTSKTSQVKFIEEGLVTDSENLTQAEVLNRWYNLLLFSEWSFQSDDEKRKPLSITDVETIGRGTYPGGKYAPDAKKFYMLLPKDNAVGPSSLTTTRVAQAIERREFSTRWDIIKEFSDVIDYQVWVTGSGDIVFEFAMYDFFPEDFAYGSLMNVNYHISNVEITEESGDPPTILTGTSASIQSDLKEIDSSFSGALKQDQIPRAVVVNPVLVDRYGVKNEEVVFPVVKTLETLQALTLLEYFKRLSDTTSMDMTFAWRPWLLPNKPIFNATDLRYGLTTSVSQTMNLFSDCTTSISLRYLRKINDEGEYVFLDGSSKPRLSYRAPWDSNLGVPLANLTSDGFYVVELDSDGKNKDVSKSVTEQVKERTSKLGVSF